jgi:hypothetical protein
LISNSRQPPEVTHAVAPPNYKYIVNDDDNILVIPQGQSYFSFDKTNGR